MIQNGFIVKKIDGEYQFVNSARRAMVMLELYGKLTCVDCDTNEKVLVYKSGRVSKVFNVKIFKKRRYKNRK